MELYIRVQNGQPFEHPIFGDNFHQAFPDVDVNNLPPEFAKFTRVEPPAMGVYEVYEGVTYERNEDGFVDVHHVRPMTAEEITAKQNTLKDAWAQHGHASWAFDEATATFTPPIAYPTDGKVYRWDEPTLSWVELVPDEQA